MNVSPLPRMVYGLNAMSRAMYFAAASSPYKAFC